MEKGREEGVGPQVCCVWGEGGRFPDLMSGVWGPYRVTYLMMYAMYLPFPCEHTDTCENITFLQLRLQAVKT